MKYVAFLKAINVGDRRMKMVDLAAFFSDLRFDDVTTYIASGNVIFSCPTPPDVVSIESAFEDQFGFFSQVFFRDETDMASILKRAPWTPDDGVTEVSFLVLPPSEEAALELERTVLPPEQLRVSEREIYFLRVGGGEPTTHKESTSMRILGTEMTRRGFTTVVKVAARMGLTIA